MSAPLDLQAEVVSAAARALKALGKGDLKSYQDVAAAIKRDCTAKLPGTWHVIVGPSFGSFVTHEAGAMAYFFIGPVGILAFKHG